MGYFTVDGGGNYSTLNAAMVAASPGSLIEGVGPWAGPDISNVVWNKAVSVRLDAASRHPGRCWQAGDTFYSLQGSGQSGQHVIVATADIDIEGMDICGATNGVSDEICRFPSGPYNTRMVDCNIGFQAAQDQQDGFYYQNQRSASFDLIQCTFYNIGRCVIDDYRTVGGTMTVNFNSCISYRVGTFGGRGRGGNEGIWLGADESNNPSKYTINVHNCAGQYPSSVGGDDQHMVRVDEGPTANFDNTITETSAARLFRAGATVPNLSGMTYDVPWVQGQPAAGQLGVLSLATTPDLRLFDDANNEAQDKHTVATGPNSGLTIPSLDNVGTARPQNTSYDVGPFEVSTAAPGLDLDVDDAQHSHVAQQADVVKVGPTWDLTVADTQIPHVAQAPLLNSEPRNLAIADSQQAHQATDAPLGVEFLLESANAQHVHQSDSAGVTVVQGPISLAVADSAHPHQSTIPLTTALWAIESANAQHVHQGESADVIGGFSLLAADCAHALQDNAGVLGVDFLIDVADTQHIHESQPCDVTSEGQLSLQVESASHVHQAQDAPFFVGADTPVGDGNHVHQVDPVSVVHIRYLAVEDAQHAHQVTENDLRATLNLVVGDCQSIHGADSAPLDVVAPTDIPLLTANADHALQDDGVAITVVYALQPADSQHVHQSSVPLVDTGLTLTDLDLAAITESVWQRLEAEGLTDQVSETWQRQGSDAANPQTFPAEPGGNIEVGSQQILVEELPDGRVRHVRQ